MYQLEEKIWFWLLLVIPDNHIHAFLVLADMETIHAK